MPISMYTASVPVFIKTLGNMAKWLDKAEAYAEATKFDPSVYMTLRLAPDMLPLPSQIRIAADAAKGAAAWLAGMEIPVFEDNETSIAELRERIRKCTGFLATVQEKDFAGAEERRVAPSWLGGRWLRGGDYLVHVAVPNFFFHVTMAYAILRHNGVVLGKADYIGGMPTLEG